MTINIKKKTTLLTFYERQYPYQKNLRSTGLNFAPNVATVKNKLSENE
ncbi:hypothetical protein CHISP_0393 [Chitinispirillum alkaliphilum]|nr:hypothetical protein CHISP_0393 [Chitinispirillum alkaliphilum]